MRANIVWTVEMSLKSMTAAAWLERSLAGPALERSCASRPNGNRPRTNAQRHDELTRH